MHVEVYVEVHSTHTSPRLGDEGVRQILKSLLKNTTLTSLNLSANNLGEPSAQSLSEVFVGNKTLTVLDLSSNGFGEVRWLCTSCVCVLGG